MSSRYGTCADRDTLDAEVARLNAAGRDDTHIALILGVGRRSVLRSRTRQNLPAAVGPGGRPARRRVAA